MLKKVTVSSQESSKDGTMEALGKAHVPYGGDGAGVYTLTTKGCFDVIENATPDVLSCVESLVESIGQDETRPIVICDFGTADGGTSLKLLNDVIGKLREHTSRDIVIQYEDQPNNDFKSLFYHTQGLNVVKDSGENTITPYLTQHHNVFVTCSGTSFFQQCFPTNSVDLSISFTAMHWLSKLPTYIKHTIHHTQLDKSSHEAAAFRAQAEDDWTRILIQRGKELRVGGRMVLVNFCVDEDGYYLGHTSSCKNNMYVAFDDIWRSMKKDGRITTEEYESTTMCNYYRSREEIEKPFHESNSVLKELGLRMISLRSGITRCPYHTYWTSPHCKMSAHEYAKLYVGTLRCWSNSTFLSALSSGRSQDEKSDIVDEVYRKYIERVACEPDAYAMDYVHHYMVFEKVTTEK